MLDGNIENRLAYLDGALGHISRIRSELKEQVRSCLRASTIKQGLSAGARYLDALGAFIDMPVSSETHFPTDTMPLLPIATEAVLAAPAVGRHDVLYYLTPKGDVARAQRIRGKLLWDRKKWLISDAEVCAIGDVALRQIQKVIRSAIGEAHKQEALV